MVKHEDMFLRNYGGVLMFRDIPLMYFKIVNGELVEAKSFRKGKAYFPLQIAEGGMTYSAINEFFRWRVVPDGVQHIDWYLRALGLERYDFEKIVKLHHGSNNTDPWWVDDSVTECP